MATMDELKKELREAEERADTESDRADGYALQAAELRERPALVAPELSPEPLRWDERERRFICRLTRRRFRLVADDD